MIHVGLGQPDAYRDHLHACHAPLSYETATELLRELPTHSRLVFFKYNLTTLCELSNCSSIMMEGIRFTTWTSWLLMCAAVPCNCTLNFYEALLAPFSGYGSSFGQSGRSCAYPLARIAARGCTSARLTCPSPYSSGVRRPHMTIHCSESCIGLAVYLLTVFYLGLGAGVAYNVLRSLIVIIAVWAGSNIFSNLLITLINCMPQFTCYSSQ